MKLYMKQKVFSWRDRFYIKNEFGEDVYYIEGELFSLGKKLHIFDMTGRELAFVQEKIFSFVPRFFVFVNERQIAEIVKKITFFKPKYEVAGLGWSVEGSFLAHDYSIFEKGREIVRIHKAWMSWGDSFEIDIDGSKDIAVALAVVLAIDCVLDRASKSSTN